MTKVMKTQMKLMTRMIQIALVSGLVIGLLLMGLHVIVAGAQPAESPSPAGTEAVANNPSAASVEIRSLLVNDSTDWPMLAANPQRTSWTPEEVGQRLRPLWYRSFDPYINAKIQVIAAHGLLYISTARGLYALDAENGDIVWVYPTELPLGHSPTVVDGAVYVGGYDRKIHALAANPDPATLSFDSVTGYRINDQVLWIFEATGNGNEVGAGFETNPLVVDNTVYAGNRDGYMYAVDAATGDLRWQYRTNGPILFSAAYEDNTIYFASNDAHGYALDTNGGLVWKSAKLPGAGFHSYWPVVYKSWVIFTGGSNYSQDRSIGLGITFDSYESEDVYQGRAAGDLVGPTGQEPGSWVDGTVTLDVSRITEYFEEPSEGENIQDPAGVNRSNHKPWRRTYFVLDRFTGEELTFDSDHDGNAEYAPILWASTSSGNKYPPAVGPDEVLYQENSYKHDSIDRGSILGWKLGTQHMSLVSSQVSPVDEPNAYAIGGNMLYYAQFWSRVGGAVDISTPNSTFPNRDQSRDYFYYVYNLEQLIPGVYRREPNNAHSYSSTNPPIPYRGKLYTNNTGTIVAWSDTDNPPVQLPVAETVVMQGYHTPVSTYQLQQRLAAEVRSIIDAGHLRPGYHRTGITDFVLNGADSDKVSYLTHYWHNPADIYVALIRALPHLPDELGQQTRTYLQREFADYPPYSIVHIGWSGAAREAFDTPPEIAIDMASFPPKEVLYKTRVDSQYRFYGLWKYAQEFGDARAIFDQVRTTVATPPSDSFLIDHPYVHNAYIAGYLGYIELGRLAEYHEDDLLLPDGQTTVRSELDRLMQLRADNLSIDSPYLSAVPNEPLSPAQYMNTLHVARNFMHLVPELADYLHEHAVTQAQDIVDTVDNESPYWFVSKYDATYSEGVLNVPFDYHSIFQAKALILKASREELTKYLDVPAFDRGDLFYIQNLIACIEAPDTGTVISLVGAVTLQGRPPAPDPAWITDLDVSLAIAGETSPRYTFNPTTSDSGTFSLSDIEPNTYEIRVKNSHTLQNLRTVTLAGGPNSVDFGTLREGDANNDNWITLLDFSVLAAAFGKCDGDAGYDTSADFNADGCVTLIDYSLLAGNFGQSGAPDSQLHDAGLYAESDGTAVLSTSLDKSHLAIGETFDVTIQLQAEGQPVDGAAAYIDFDPAILQVVSITPGDTLSTVILSEYFNENGQVNYAAGLLGSSATGTFTLVSVTFEAVRETDGTWLRFEASDPRKSDATFKGVSVLDHTESGTLINVRGNSSDERKVYLPLIMQ